MSSTSRSLRTVPLAVAFCIATVLTTSCQHPTEPTSGAISGASPVQRNSFAPINLTAGDTLSGGIFVRFRPERDSLAITSLQLFVDRTLVTAHTAGKYEFFFDTEGFPDGVHNLVFELHESDPSGRLSTLLPSLTRIYTTSLVFEHYPLPPAPTNVQFHWVFMGHPTITWASPGDSLLDHFTIERTYPTRFSTTVASAARSYVDTSIVCLSAGFEYRVGAGNIHGTRYARCSY